MAKKQDLMSGAERIFSRGVAGAGRAENKPVQSPPDMAPPARRGRPSKNEETLWNGKQDYHTSCVFDLSQYSELKEIAYAERLSLKETMYLMLEASIDRYRKTGKLPSIH